MLPFANMSGDQAQEYLADGITEAIITDLSKIYDLNFWKQMLSLPILSID